MLLLSWLSTFLTNNAVFAWARARFPPAFHHVFHNFSLFSALQRSITRIMGRPLDAKPAAGAADQRPQRRMVHLKTKEECRLGNETIRVWTLELPSKHAEGILKVIKENVPGYHTVDLQHLRRFAKPKFLPDHVLGERDRVKEMYSIPRAWETNDPVVIQQPDSRWEWSTPGKLRVNSRPQTLYLMVCPSNVIGLQDLHDLMIKHSPFASGADSWAYPLEIKEVTVPRLAPTSPEQAATWSEQYWPTFYRKTNPFGAHPATIEKAKNELETPQAGNLSIDQAMALADQAGTATEKCGFGIHTGCVVVERVDDKTEIIAVAGDARLRSLPSEGGKSMPSSGGGDSSVDSSLLADGADGTDEPDAGGEKVASKAKRKKMRKRRNKALKAGESDSNGCSSGNVMAHAAMRALGMVGRKRLRVASQPVTAAAAKAESNFSRVGLEHDEQARDAFFLDTPLTPVEQQYFALDNLKPDGYLCLKLEIFLTHEPCMMCSMALVHSRVGRVVFANRMPRTGGLTAEMVRNDTGPVGLGYGLCWRKELNWQFMCWEWTNATYALEQKRKQERQAALVQQRGVGVFGGGIGGKKSQAAITVAAGGETDDEDSDEAAPAFDEDHDDEDANAGKLSFTSVHV
ncbi:hypothetical protein KC351_g5003 [Hortaea werneckii]|nr:hypothetical protein KC351_g5003 [Hortaea werneckii]